MNLNAKIRKIITNYQDPNSWISRRRAHRVGPLLATIRHIYRINGQVRIIDLGGHRPYWNIVRREFLADHHVKITLLNLPSKGFGPNDDIFHHQAGDACNLEEFTDNAFDIVHSNSVIEHVGDWERIKSFASESRRLAPYHFIQTPYFWFPIEPHYVRIFHQWLPWPWRARRHLAIQAASKHRIPGPNIDRAMTSVFAEPFLLDQRTFEFLFPDSALVRERALGVFVKSLIAFRGPT